ncbi:MAG: Ig-like domain-containing protein [Lachnospiraceae bacterium]|nr:Ig-like domain-containing protein [Lachnospiraceae bacterium]
MRKLGHKRRYIKFLSYMMVALMALLQPCSALAAEMSQPEDVIQSEDTVQPEAGSIDSVKYIVGFEALAEEDAYFPCMYKPMLEELLGVFPETLLVWLDGEEEPVELTVAWECEEDFDATRQPYYVFYPKWDETQYAVKETSEDSIEIPVITVEVPQTGGILQNPEEAKNSLYLIIQKKAVLASIYLCDEYEVKAEPSLDSETVHTVVSGQSVQITDVETDEYGGIWYQVLLYQNGVEYTGYVEKGYLATSDEDFAGWEETYLDLSAIPMVMDLSEGGTDIDEFPASYQNALYALKEKHPEWIFVRMDTGLDWNTAIANELGDKSWISSSKSGSWQNGSAPQRGWSYASEGILKYYMDPRNFLDDAHIFQFEQLIYNSSYHTTDAVEGILAGSFMASAIPDDGRTYAQAFTTIGQELGVSPFHLASRVLQEQGVRGSSALISGTYPGYEGYYNYFNVSASGTGDAETIRRGLAKAKMEGWNTRYSSLYGGAKIIGNQYILWGQDTLYLEKFNVANGKYANYTHQYMQNIEAPYCEASSIYKAYQKAGVLERRFVFKIPVYENMPASACAQPEKTDAITLDKTSVSSLEVDKSITLVPYVNGSKVDHVNDMTFTSSNPAVAVVDAQGKVTALSPGDTTVTCARGGASSANCTVTVVKADPVVATPVLSPVTYREGIRLADVALPSGWVWVNGDISLSVGTPAYEAVYTPADTTKYNTVTKNISVTVTKTVPVCQVPTGLEVEVGAVLGSIVLPDGFLWESNAETVLTDAGEYTFYVSYNPDENNYYTVNHIPIIVQVKEAASEPTTGGNSGGSTGNGGTTSGSGTSGGSGTGTGTGTGNGSAGSGTGSGTGTENESGGSTGSGAGTENGSGGSTGSGTSTESSNSGSSGGGTSTESSNSGSSGGGTSTESSNSGNSGSGTSTESSNSSESGSSASSGSTQPPATAGSTAAGNISPSAPTGSTTAGSSQPEAAGSSGQSGNASLNTTAGNPQSGTQEVTAANENDTDNVEENNTSGEETENTEQPEEPSYFRPAVTIQMEDTTILTTEKMQMAKEQNFDLLLDMGGAVSWSIDVDSIDASIMAEVDMGVELGTNNVPQELISTILNGNKYLEITLAHQGEFGFEPVLNVALGKEYSGKYANLFYYDPETETLEFICDAIIGPDGVASLRFEHASCYLIVVSDESMSGVSFEDETVNPVTRWIIIGVFVCMLLVVVGYGIFFFLRKRREENDEDDEEEDDEEDEEEDDEDEDEDEYSEEDEAEEEPYEEYEAEEVEESYEEYEAEEIEESYEEYEAEEIEESYGEYEAVEIEESYEEYEAEEVEEPYEEYGKSENEPHKYEAGETPVRHFQTFDLKSVEAEKGHRGENSEQKKMPQQSWKGIDVESENDGYCDEDDWIEDDEWQEPESDARYSQSASKKTSTEDEWLDDEENAEDDWIEDDEWVE